MSLPTLQTERKIKYENTTTYKKHRALVITLKVCVYLQSPLNIKFGIYTKIKAKYLYLAKL